MEAQGQDQPNRNPTTVDNGAAQPQVQRGTDAATQPQSGTVGPNTIKTSVNLTQDSVEALRKIAAERGTTMTEVMRHAISLEKFMHDEARNGNKILVGKDDQYRQLLIT